MHITHCAAKRLKHLGCVAGGFAHVRCDDLSVFDIHPERNHLRLYNIEDSKRLRRSIDLGGESDIGRITNPVRCVAAA